MKVFKCDRCGKVYDEQNEDALYLVGKFGYIRKDLYNDKNRSNLSVS